jgi:biotin transport system ATP-binding protein
MITFENVGHAFGDRRVLTDITCTLSESRIGIIGANGSGKSTLARMINGLVTPTEGAVRVRGLDPTRKGAEVRRLVSFLFSDPDAQIVMPTVGEDIGFSLRRRKLTQDQVQDATRAILATVGLSDYFDHPAHLLSSGQKQLLALASVLVTEPEILVCDEPTTLLDLRNTREVAELLASLPQQIILVTHDLDLVYTWERVLVIDAGRIVADGSGEESIDFYQKLLVS